MLHYASQLCNSLSNNSADNEVFLIAPTNINRKLFDSNVQIMAIPNLGRHGYRIDLVWKYIQQLKPDIVHLTVIHPFILPILYSLKTNFMFVSTIHDVALHSDQDNLFLNMTTSFIAKASNLIFVHGEKLKSELSATGIPEEKISVVPHGDYSFFGTINQKNIPEETNNILFFGRILKYKGIDYLIEAEPILSSKISDFKITVAGNGDFSQYEKRIDDYKHFEVINEYIPDEKVAELFQRASVVVLPYIEGSQSGIVPIAYSFKKPVIVTDVGCISDVVVDGVTGFVIPPKDSESLALAIFKILSDDNLKAEMSENAYEFMKGKMSWDEVAKKTISEYLKIINANARGKNEY
ncbi:glycosyltransferase family 4 protein [Methanolobus sp. WCC1]|uniref:glycosyltransferase family 4 protein n=1 Tax=unclassified Methanolobus TaxID=2629569 RepID=UPI0032487C9B